MKEGSYDETSEKPNASTLEEKSALTVLRDGRFGVLVNNVFGPYSLAFFNLL